MQHIESIKDDVSQIIQVPIKETVPDSMLDRADMIELVDIPPEELLDRLREGKVYIPAQAELATENFFRKGNLIALRELALRITARFVGAQVFHYRKDQRINIIWPTKEKILVCVGPGSEAQKLIRGARRMASSLQAEWMGVYVDSARLRSPKEKLKKGIQNLSFAEQLGAETRVLTGYDIVKEIMTFAREQNITQIMIWKHIRPRLRDVIFKSLADEIVRNCREIDVYIMTGDVEETNLNKPYFFTKVLSWNWKTFILAIGIVAFATIWYHFSAGNFEFLFAFIVILLMGYIISHLTSITRYQAKSALKKEQQTSALYTLSRQLAHTRGSDKLLEIGSNYIAKLFDSDVIILSLEHVDLATNDKEKSTVQWVYDLGQMAGLGTNTLPSSDSFYVPLQGSRQILGVLKITPHIKEILLEPEQLRLLEACANQIALALEVDRLHEQTKKMELQKEIDRVLMQIAYIETISVKINKQFSSLESIITKVVNDSERKLGKRTVHIQIPENAPLIPFDRILIEEVFINLIDNAVKFSPTQSPIEIFVILQQDADKVLVSVEDQGRGIVQDEIDKLFEKFYRGRLSSESGIGLGLAICQKIILAHQGEIWAENRNQGGAAFRFTLPIHDPEN